MASIPRWAWLPLLAALLVLLAGPAFALGLGKIEIRSQRGEPLLAEIQIISSDPAELEGLQARLASPDTFARVGLEPPQGIVTGLQFTPALDPQGNPVIRVTSQQPVDQDLLTFLVEVDWGQGRLVREYSVLLDAPDTVAAPVQPSIQEATPAPSNTIVREPAPAPVPAPPPPPPPPPPAETPAPEPQAAAEAATAVAGASAEPEPQSNAIPAPAPAAPAPPPAASPVAAPPVAAPPGEYTVQAGDTLGEIARMFEGGGHTHAQTMLALLRANPEAFIKDNINLVRQGAVLRMPSQQQLSQYSAREARAVVREQIAQWRAMHTPAPQPVAVAGEGGTTASAQAGSDDTMGAGASDARLEIVPPAANGGGQAGTRSGIDAGGEGDMLRQQELQQARETLAARDAEVQDLKARVADLEKLQHDQQTLIALKDSRLAEAQQALAARQAATTTAQAGTPTPAADGAMLWPWLIAALVVVLLAAWLLMRRKPAKKPVRPVFDTSALAAGAPEQADAGRHEPPVVTVADAPAPAKADATVQPTWHSGTHPDAPVDAVAGNAVAGNAAAESVSPLNPAPAGHERLELARAYLDLGDVDTARSLLQEVADGGDAAARGEAVRLLRDLV